MKKKLSLVGSGIKTIAHLTKEAESYITKADLVLYLVNEPVLEEWIEKNSKKSKSLENIYFSSDNRDHSYELISNEIIKSTFSHEFVCVLLYGHPTIFSRPGLDAIKEASSMGIETKIIPAISSEDCLFADLMIDPSDCGFYSIEATDLLLHKRFINIDSHLIIWQLGLLGNIGHERGVNIEKMAFFIEYLSNFYSENNNVFIYEASMYPGMDCKIEKLLLKDLIGYELSKISTLYIPPIHKKEVDLEMLKKLGLEKNA